MSHVAQPTVALPTRSHWTAWLGAALAAAGVVALAACGDYLSVTNPGPIEDTRLDTPEAVPGMVGGMSGDLSVVFDEVIRITAIASDELAHGGSYTSEGLWYRGIIRPEDVNDLWAGMQRARWVAEHGIERMKGIRGYNYEGNILSARANLLAGFANRTLGENTCQAVIDKGPAEDYTVHFQRADGYFTEALRLAQKLNDATITNAAFGGRASVRAWLGKWDDAVQDAQQVPSGFAYSAVFSENSTRENNSLVQETYVRREFTVFNTPWAQVFGDPRVQWDTIKTSSGAIQKGQDGRTNFFRQRKYTTLGADVPLTKGTEMLMLRAEAALRKGDIAQAFTLINQQRAVYRMSALATPSTLDAAWRTLQTERGAVLWLEARRLWDMRRWFAESGPASAGVLARIPTFAQRDKCIPISKEERESNPNLKG